MIAKIAGVAELDFVLVLPSDTLSDEPGVEGVSVVALSTENIA